MAGRGDIDRIAHGFGAQRPGAQEATGGYSSVIQLAADVKARLKIPKGGGRATDPAWTERRVLPLAQQTLARLETLSKTLRDTERVRIDSMQLAALILEQALERLTE